MSAVDDDVVSDRGVGRRAAHTMEYNVPGENSEPSKRARKTKQTPVPPTGLPGGQYQQQANTQQPAAAPPAQAQQQEPSTWRRVAASHMKVLADFDTLSACVPKS